VEIVRKNLFESPDGIEADNLYDITGETDLGFYHTRAIAFGYYKNEMRIGKPDDAHGMIHMRYNDMGRDVSRYAFKYGGRIWPSQKVMSFWNYPPTKEFPKVLKDLQKEIKLMNGNSIDTVHVDFTDPNWSIEVITEKINNDSQPKQEWDVAKEATLILFDEYVGSENQSAIDQAKAHVMSPLKKLRRPQDSAYFKIRNSKEKSLAWKQALLKSESLKESLGAPLYEKLLMGEPVTIEELRDILHRKVLNFEFIKLDGEVRPAKGTTMMKYIPKEDHPTGDHPSSDKVAAFYDLSKDVWRSVSNRSSEIVLVQDEDTGKIKVQISDKVPKEPTERKPEISKVPGASQRPIIPKSEPIVRPSLRPDVIPQTPDIEDIEAEEEPETPLDINDPDIKADDVKDQDIIAPEVQEEPEIEVETPEIPTITTPKPVVRPNIQQNEPVTELPPKEDITFPEEEEEDEEAEEV